MFQCEEGNIPSELVDHEVGVEGGGLPFWAVVSHEFFEELDVMVVLVPEFVG